MTQLNSKINHPKLNININNNIKAQKYKEKREEKGDELLSQHVFEPSLQT